MAIKKFAMICDNDVFSVLIVNDDPSENPNGPRMVAGLSSNPIVVEITNNENIFPGFTYDGKNFYAPEEDF